MTEAKRDDLVRWNEFCRSRVVSVIDARGRSVSKPSPIRFISALSMGALGYIFSDFGAEFLISDKTGEPPVQRVITGISCEEEGIVSLLDPNESELAKKADIPDTPHEGFISFSEVDGMYCKEEHNLKTLGHSINSSGVWRAHEVWKRVPDYLIVPRARGGDGVMKSAQYFVHQRDEKTGQYKTDPDRPDGLYWAALFVHECKDIPEEDFVRDANGERMMRMTEVKEHYKIKIGDTRGYSKYQGGGIVQQVYQPVSGHHKSLAESLQQPLGVGERQLQSVDGDKEGLQWWYPMLHIVKQGLLQFQQLEGRLPRPNDAAEADRVIALCKQYNAAMRSLQSFCGMDAAMATLDLEVEPRSPPTTNGLSDSQLDALKALKDMGTPEERALLALEVSSWSADEALMTVFDEERMAMLEASVNTHKCLSAMKRLILAAGVELQPVSVFIGGVCAQEVVKHCGKFTPINQWIQYDCIEVLPDVVLPANATLARGTRYDNNIAVFGDVMQERLKDIKTFMVGCGALGCELLKNFAMLGVACGPNGLITVTDGDRIEVSNLNRQFLFRKQHVKKSKSLTAAEAVKAMNHSINVEALELLAAPDTEKNFDDCFWIGTGRANPSGLPREDWSESDGGLSFVVNALDNVKARKYVDSRCVYYHKALLESGTEGTKFNHQVVIPDQTVSYDEGEPDAPEGEAIPMCTLRNFPSTIVHCIEWARGQFEDLFVTPIADLQNYLNHPNGYIENLKEQLDAYMMDANDIQLAMDKLRDKEGNGLLRSVRQARYVRDHGYAACIKLAHELFTQRFNHSMRDLQHQFPRDLVTNGKPFWAPPKRYPTPLEVDMADESVASFIVSVANLYAVAYGVHPLPMSGFDNHGNDIDTFIPENSQWRSVTAAANALPSSTEPWKPSSVKIEVGDKDEEEQPQSLSASLEDMIAELQAELSELAAVPVEELKGQPAEFEKDADLNFHIDFVSAAANLRASNYGIPRATRHKTKMIAGKIIAAIATSTACATALVCIELLKIVQKKAKNQYRDSSCNFAVNQFQMSEPQDANVIKGCGEKRSEPDPVTQPEYFDESGNIIWDKVPVRRWKAYPDPHTKWDKITLSSSLTLQEAVMFLREKHNLRLVSWVVTMRDSSGKTQGKEIYGEPRVDPSIDEQLLLRIAPMDITEQKARIAIMKCPEMKNKQSYTQRWSALKLATGEEHQKKMNTSLRVLLESYLGNLNGMRSVELEVNLEIASEPGVEAVHPPIVMKM